MSTSLFSQLKNRFFLKLRARPGLQNLPYWISAVLTGLTGVGYAWAFTRISAISESILAHHPWWFLGTAPFCFVLAWWLVARYAPEASGSGIPQVMAANELELDGNESRIEALLGARTAIVKVASSLICLFGGGAIGREGPTIQVAAAMFQSIGTRFRKLWPGLSPSMTHQSWIVAGGAAGIAAAFNTPLGGLVFAIEELATSHFAQFRTVLISGVILAGLVSQWILGPYLYLGFPHLGDFAFSVIPLALLVGVISGLSGGLFGRALFVLSGMRARVGDRRQLALFALSCGAVMAAGALIFGSRATGSGVEMITDQLFHRAGPVGFGWAVIRFAGTIISYISGCAGGIFSPSLAVGAAIGSQIALWAHSDTPNVLVLLGMIGFLTGVARAPFTSFVLVLEMSSGHAAILPMMLASLSAHAAARAVDPTGFYEHIKERYLAAYGHGPAPTPTPAPVAPLGATG